MKKKDMTGSLKMNESQLRKFVSNVVRESLQNAKPWVNNTGYQVGNWDDSEVKKWNNAYNKPNDGFAQDAEEFTYDLDNRKDYWDATVKDFRNAIQSDPKLKKEISDMIKNGEYSGFDDKELISDWADAHLWGRPNPNSEYWKFRKGIETGGMETAKSLGDKYRNEYYKDDSEDELWHAHDNNDKKDFKRLSSPMSESKLRKVISKVIRESLEEAGYGSLKTTSVYDPIGYFACRQNVYDSIMRNGFDPEMLGNTNHSMLGNGFYFCTEVPGKDMQRFYGDKIIKVRVLGEYEAYDSRIFGRKIFVVHPNDADNIEIIQDENPYGDRVGQWTTTMSNDIYESRIRKIVREALKESMKKRKA